MLTAQLKKRPMRTTVTIDDNMLERAKEFSGISENPKLVCRAIEYIIAFEKGNALARETGNIDDVRLTVRKLFDKIEDN